MALVRAHVGSHEHRGGTVHAHLHWRVADENDSNRKEIVHPHASTPLRRALLVGSLHGLGGSALLGLLAARGAHAGQAIAYAAVFGLGATAGMLALSTTISLPLRSPGLRAVVLGRRSRVAVAAVSIAIGAWIGARALLRIDLAQLAV